MALSLDRQAFIDIITEGQGDIGGVMQPAPAGLWGMPPEMLNKLPGYDPDVQKNRAEGQQIMHTLGYGPDNHVKIKVTARDIPYYRDPAVILIDQLKQVYVDGELEVIDTSVYYNRVFKKDYVVALNLSGVAVDDPDVALFENYGCGSLRNYNNYCDAEMTKLFQAQSRELDPKKRQQMVWDIDHKLQAAIARPISFHGRAAGCWQPQVKNLTLHINSIYNNWRFEDVWLER